MRRLASESVKSPLPYEHDAENVLEQHAGNDGKVTVENPCFDRYTVSGRNVR